MITLLAPLGLLALAALTVPVLIHLIRRSERKEVDFAALRWLRQRSRPRKQLHLHDRVLLALRLLLIAALALLLALPVRYLQGEPGSSWVLVSPQVDPAAARAALRDAGGDWHWLAPGFPPIDAPVPTDTEATASTASLIREADAQLPPATRLHLVVPQVIDGLDAGRLRLGHTVDWQILPGLPQMPRVDAPLPTLRVAVRGSAPQEVQRVVVRALLKAWQAGGRDVSIDESTAPIAVETALLFWLGGEPDAASRRWISEGGRAIASSMPASTGVVVLSADDGTPLLRDETVGRGHLFALAAALTPAALPSLLDPAFPKRLLVQVEARPAGPTSAAASAVTPLPIQPAPRGPHQPLDRWIAVLVAALFLLERIWTARRRGVLA
jgi:hypothetical protein